jgi:tetrahydromethanopterin S-methyltransferase subunit F
LQVGYLFGSIINETGTQLSGEDIPSAYRTVVYDRTGFSDLSIKGGLSFFKQIRRRTFFNIGLIYELEGEKNAKHMVRLERRTLTNAITSSMDTIVNDVKGSVRLPSTIGLGVSLFKTLKWTIASDVVYQNWSAYRSFNGTASELADRYRIGIGGEYTPNITSMENYLSRITYRMGFNYEKTPFEHNEDQLRDFGINFGMSLPVSGRSSLDLAFSAGQRGTTGNQAIKEEYFRVYLGVTFNDKWFVRRKLD